MNIYLIKSSYYRLIKNEIKKIMGNNEYLTLDISKNSIDILYEETSYLSLDNNKKYIIVKNLFNSKLSEPDEKRLISFLDNPPKDSIIIFVTDTIDLRKKIGKAFKEKTNFIIFDVDYKNVNEYINKYIISNKFKADYKTISYLINLYGINLDLIYNELDKLFIYYENPCEMKYNDVLEIVSKPIDDNNFHFVDALVNKKGNDIYNILNDLITSKVDTASLIILIAREFRLMYFIKYLYNERKNISEIISITKLLEWQINKTYKNSLNFTEKEILEHIKSLAKYDELIKTGRINKDVALHNFIISVIA